MSGTAKKPQVEYALNAGDKAPDFDPVPADDGESYGLSDFAGKTLVLYFYPKDDTPGCTTEGKDFSNAIEEFDAAGAVVVGVSKDSINKHCKFRDKHGLKVLLLSDEEGDLCEQFGTWVEKSMYGKKYMGIDRATFVIDGEGTIRQTWRKVKVSGHVQEVLGVVKGL